MLFYFRATFSFFSQTIAVSFNYKFLQAVSLITSYQDVALRFLCAAPRSEYWEIISSSLNILFQIGGIRMRINSESLQTRMRISLISSYSLFYFKPLRFQVKNYHRYCKLEIAAVRFKCSFLLYCHLFKNVTPYEWHYGDNYTKAFTIPNWEIL